MLKKILSERKHYHKKFKNRTPALTVTQKIEKFILRNSKSGYFTKVSTIPYKFEISENKSWDVVGELLSDGLIESVHDEITGEMKLCEAGKTYSIMDLEKKRKREKTRSFNKKGNKKKPNG